MKSLVLIIAGSMLHGPIALAQTLCGAAALDTCVIWRALPDFHVDASNSESPPPLMVVTGARLDSRLQMAADSDPTTDREFLKLPTGYLSGARLEKLQASYRASSSGLSDPREIALVLSQEVKKHPDLVTEIVAREVLAHPDCSCEIVKAAIESSEANEALVLRMTEAAIAASPEHMRLITQCAMAQFPAATQSILALLARLDPNAGESGTSSKDAKVSMATSGPPSGTAAAANPLDLLPTTVLTPAPIIPPLLSSVDP